MLEMGVNRGPEWFEMLAVFHSPDAFIIIIHNMVRNLSTSIYWMDSEFIASHGEELPRIRENRG